MTVWELVSDDKYELPLVIADTEFELSDRIGRSVNAIRTSYCGYKRGRRRKSLYYRVETDEDVEKGVERDYGVMDYLEKEARRSKGVIERLREWLQVGKTYMMDKVEYSPEDRKTVRRNVRMKLIRLYPHHALFESYRGIRESYTYWELAGRMKEEAELVSRA